MKNKITQSLDEFSGFLKILIILSLLIGIFLRFYHLDGKIYSNDETFSTTRIFGRDVAEVIDSRIITGDELQNYQRLNPNESVNDAITRVITKPFVFPPLYSILMQLWVRFWINYFDQPAVLTRSLSAFISLFSLIGMYWLCWELSGSKTMAWIATALIAISPFHLQYSQIVRTYSFTTAATLLSSASLLRAMRVQTKLSWIAYAVSVATGLYSNLLFGFVAIAHGAYVFLSEKFRFSKTLKSYILAAFAGGAAFLPWFILFISAPGLLGYTVEQVVEGSSFVSLMKTWVINLRPMFIDFYDPWVESTKNFRSLQALLFIFIVGIVIISIYFIVRKAPKPVRLFTLSLIIFTGIILMVKDLITGGTVSNRLRYMIPYVLGLEIAVAYFLTTQLQETSSFKRKLGVIAVSTLLVGGIVSCGIISQANSWWAFGSPHYPQIARKINQETRPVIIFASWGDALTMSYLVTPNVHFHLTRRADFHLIQNKGKIYGGFSDILLAEPSNTIRRKLEEGGLKLKLLFDSKTSLPQVPQVWRVQKP